MIGSGTTSLTIIPTALQRLHSLTISLTYSGGTNTLAALAAVLTGIRVLAGSRKLWNLKGAKLRDWLLLHGTTYDWNGLPNAAAIVTLPFAPEWFTDIIADGLALNPALLGAPIRVEIDGSTALTVNNAFEETSDDLNADSYGVLTLETISPVAGSTAFAVKQPEIELRGRLLSVSVYPDSTNSNEITPCSLQAFPGELFIHQQLSSAENDERLERYSLTPAASGRTANIYDIVLVKSDMLSQGLDLPGAGKCYVKVEAAATMAGTCDIVLCRLEPNKL